MVPLLAVVGARQVNIDSWSMNGTWSTDARLGPQQGGHLAGAGLVHLGDGAVATFTPAVAFDHVNTYCATDVETGSLAVLVDGAAVGSACNGTSPVPMAHVASSIGVASGGHQVDFRCSGSCLLYAAEATSGTTGVSVHNVGAGGAAAEWFGTPGVGELDFIDLIPGGVQVAISDLLTNDPGVGYTVASYTSAMQSLIEHEKGLGTSVLVVVPPVSRIQNMDEFPAYTSALLEVTAEAGVKVANIQSSWGASFDPTSGFWSADDIHPNDAGSAAEYALIRAGLGLP